MPPVIFNVGLFLNRRYKSDVIELFCVSVCRSRFGWELNSDLNFFFFLFFLSQNSVSRILNSELDLLFLFLNWKNEKRKKSDVLKIY